MIAVPSAPIGTRIAQAVLDARLAACAQLLGPMTSTYIWKGRQESARERLLLFKTERSRRARLVRLVRSLHPYEVPEILVLPIVAADDAYARWVRAALQAGHRSSS
jgi:periplasmic divalent cation tolerance protein